MIKEQNCYFFATRLGNSAFTNTMLQSAYELARRGHRVLLLPGGGKYELANSGANPAVFVWPSPRPTRLKDFRFLHNLIREHHPDCVVTDGYASSNVILLTGWLDRVSCRVSWYRTLQSQVRLQNQHLTGTAKYRSWLLQFRKYAVWRLTKPYFVANSTAAKLDVTRYLNIKEDSRVLAFGHLLHDPQLSCEVSSRNLVCVARLAEDKGQDTLIRAVSLLVPDYPDLSVEFIGDGIKRQEYEQLVRELNLQQHCVFVGRIDNRKVLQKMASAYALVLPSLSEAYGLVNVEAMSVGTPVVASNVGGIPDIVRDGIDGLLFAPGDHHALADKLKRLLSSRDMRDEMGRNARQRFVERFSMDTNIGKLADWFEHIVATERSK